MLVANAGVEISPIHGFGLFALEPISKGTLIWRFDAGFDQRFSPADLAPLPELARRTIIDYCYRCMESGDYILCIDDARFMNHSEQANTHEVGSGEVEQTLASRDIAAGEEITCDYYSFDADADEKLGTKHEAGG